MSIENGEEQIVSPRVAREMADAEKPYHEAISSKIPIIKSFPIQKGREAGEKVGIELEEKMQKLFDKLVEIKNVMKERGLSQIQASPFAEVGKGQATFTHPDKTTKMENYGDYESLPRDEQELIKNDKSYEVEHFVLTTGEETDKFSARKINRQRVNLVLPKLKTGSSLNYNTSFEDIDVEDLNNPDLQDFLVQAIESGWTPEILNQFIDGLKNEQE
jgi:hypothetical protein